jgi:uncharacterized protein (DUF433 family)
MDTKTLSSTTIIRTERGLTISGTRITLYDVMDYVSQYPTKFITSLLNLTDEQINTATSYIAENRSEVEEEYQIVLKQAEENQQYWTERNLQHLVNKLPKPGQEALWEKLQAQKAQHALEA